MIQAMIQSNVMIDGRRHNRLAVVAGGHLYAGDLRRVNLVNGGFSLFPPNVRPSGAASQGRIYFVDGTPTITRLNAMTGQIMAYEASAGEAPSGCRLACIYRDRLVLSGADADAHNVFFSRAGVHTDWDYGRKDPAAAVALNAGLSGRIEDIVTALIPFVDDALVIGGDHTIHRLSGDPADNGVLDRISAGVGVLGQDAWCQDAAGNIYFVGATGFFRMQIDGAIQNLSAGRYNRFFQQIDRNRSYVQARWDRDRHGIWIFVTPRDTALQPRHLWYDLRTDGFFPMEFPSTFGPVSSLVYDGDEPKDRLVLLGSRSGYIRMIDELSLADDGVPITSHVAIGPVKPAGDLADAKLIHLETILGEWPPELGQDEDWSLSWTLQAGPDAETALNRPPVSQSGTWTTPGRQKPQGTRLAGNSFFLRLWHFGTARLWSMDRIIGRFLTTGRKRP